jgi:hypothetical protein
MALQATKADKNQLEGGQFCPQEAFERRKQPSIISPATTCFRRAISGKWTISCAYPIWG